jgi:murein DD-endopeptidase MepM/ murein hydrolase activator NlpD
LSSRGLIKAGDHLTILPTTGVLHTVKSGETVLGIAKKYDADAKEIIAYNNIQDHKINIGQKIIVPDGYIQAASSVPNIKAGDTRVASVDSGSAPASATVTGPGMVWPTTSRHISQYFRWGHTGIDIDNRAKPPIYAASSGTVEFAGWLGGYGNLIIINHGNGIQTYYAHLEQFYVNKGASVAAGAAIAKMGSTGRSTGPHLHFEVRRGGQPINPMGMF